MTDKPEKQKEYFANLISDGFGSVTSAYCHVCGERSMYVNRPGDIRCGNQNCKENK